MAILVTGGAGFIGAEVVRTLVDRGSEDVHITYHSGRLQRLRGVEERIGLHQLDLADASGIQALVSKLKPRAIYHLGAMLSGPSEADPQASIRTNAFGTHALLEAARTNGTEQFLFASSIGSFMGSDRPEGPISDVTLQRPDIVYGVSKVFGELLGRYYRIKYGLDFRGIRYPGVVGPGVTTWSIAQFISWMIERPARGEPFSVWATPETATPIVYFKEAGDAMVRLADAPVEAIRTVNYLIDGIKPAPTAGEEAEAVRRCLPAADIRFEPDPPIQALLDKGITSIDDSCARDEWGWSPTFGLDAIVADFVEQLRRHPERYIDAASPLRCRGAGGD